jgi:uncharacterized protein
MSGVGSEPDFIRRQRAFTRHLRDPAHAPAPPDLPPARLAVYSNAIYLNLERFMRDNFPRVREQFDDAGWQALVRDYIIRHRSETPLFVELLDEFVAYLEHEREIADDPPYLLELAHFDWLENAVAIDETRLDGIPVAAAGDLLHTRLVLNPVHQLVTYRYPVHAIGSAFRPEAAPARPTQLLAFRDRAGNFGVLDLNDVAVRLFCALRAPGAPAASEVLAALARELRHPDPAVVRQGGLQLLERWQARDVILGFAPDG